MREVRVGRHLMLVDDEDFPLASSLCLRALKSGHTKYPLVYVGIYHGGEYLGMFHRALLGIYCPETRVDHINHNGLDNRRENLRLCTVSENARNKRSRWGRDLPKGVFRDSGKYRVRIDIGDRIISDGPHEDVEIAAAKYAALAVEHFGPFAYFDDRANQSPQPPPSSFGGSSPP